MLLTRVVLAAVVAFGLVATPLDAQPQAGKMWRIGVLTVLYPADAAPPQALRQRLRELGYVEGQNIVIEWRDAHPRDDRLPGLAADLVRLKVDVIVTDVSVATRAAMQATSTIPIVMVLTADAL